MGQQADEMEFGDTGWVPLPNGWWENRVTGDRRSPDGRIYDENGELFFDPNEDDIEYDEDEYEYYEDEEYDY